MRLHEITLRDVRGVTERTVRFPDRGVVVVEGPNEIGKSTLLEAFDRLLDLKATSKSARAQALQPIGRDVGPFVEAEFTLGGQRVRLAKQWLRGARTELDILGDRPEHLTGSAAQARLDQLVAGLDSTLWDALRLAQSGDGTLVPLMSSGVLQEALDAAADAHLHDGGGERVLELVEEEFLRYFTARTARPTGDYRLAIEAYHAAQADVAEAHRRLVEAEELLARQERARQAAEHAHDQVGGREGALRGAEEAADAVAEIVTAHERAADRLREARTLARAAEQALRLRRERVDAVARLAAVVAEHEEQLAGLAGTGASVKAELAQAQESLVAAESAVEVAETTLEHARARREVGERRAELDELERAVASLRGLAAQVQRERRALPGSPVSEAQRRAVERLAQEVAVLEARHESASARVSVESLGAEVRLSSVEGDGPEVLTRDETRELAATDDLEVVVPGAVRVVVRSPDGARRRAELGTAREALTTALERLGCEDVRQVEEASARTAEATGRLQEAERDLSAMLAAHGITGRDQQEALSSGDIPPRLQERVDACRRRVAGLEDDLRRDPTSPVADLPGAAGQGGAAMHAGQQATSDLRADDSGRDDELVVTEAAACAAEAEQTAGERLRAAREARRAASSAWSTSRDRAREVMAALDRLHGQLESERERLAQDEADLLRERSDHTDDALSDDARRLGEELAVAEHAATEAEDALRTADVQGLTTRVREGQSALAAARRDHERARELLHTLTGQVELAASEGRQELYALAEAALDDAERRLAGLDRRARAVRHLRGALHEHRESAHRAYVRPFTAALERLGRQVYGPSFAVTIDEQLSVRARTLDGVTVPFEELSGGAKEQLGILARIAVAHLVDPAQGVPVVIDDALGYSDPQRLEQMGRIFADGAAGEDGDVQVILLTCTPDRYATIPGAHTVRLQAS
ncbi:AAA family ATPase [Serinicoccus profundi]|uniref:AAA family ATPase n=1 Tax=Serinicoccus profundi TaxID=1078471 RepID=UPI000255EAC7|nr:AAA family ATPase [Serinicoccus profundi]